MNRSWVGGFVSASRGTVGNCWPAVAVQRSWVGGMDGYDSDGSGAVARVALGWHRRVDVRWPMELRSRRVGTAYHADVSREGRSPWDRDNYW